VKYKGLEFPKKVRLSNTKEEFNSIAVLRGLVDSGVFGTSDFPLTTAIGVLNHLVTQGFYEALPEETEPQKWFAEMWKAKMERDKSIYNFEEAKRDKELAEAVYHNAVTLYEQAVNNESAEAIGWLSDPLDK
jgi:hypothetical protein